MIQKPPTGSFTTGSFITEVSEDLDQMAELFGIKRFPKESAKFDIKIERVTYKQLKEIISFVEKLRDNKNLK